jgi:hypothetical protein
MPRNLFCKYICAVWHSEQTIKGRLIKRGASLLVAVTFPHDISRGDFKFIMPQSGCIGNIKYSKALDEVLPSLELTDVWATSHSRAINTNCTQNIAARVELLCVFEPT